MTSPAPRYGRGEPAASEGGACSPAAARCVRAGLGPRPRSCATGRRRSRCCVLALAAPHRRPAQRSARLRLKPAAADARRLLPPCLPCSCSLFARSGVQPAAPAAVGVACRAVRGRCRAAGASRAPQLAPACRSATCRLNAFLAASRAQAHAVARLHLAGCHAVLRPGHGLAPRGRHALLRPPVRHAVERARPVRAPARPSFRPCAAAAAPRADPRAAATPTPTARCAATTSAAAAASCGATTGARARARAPSQSRRAAAAAAAAEAAAGTTTEVVAAVAGAAAATAATAETRRCVAQTRSLFLHYYGL